MTKKLTFEEACVIVMRHIRARKGTRLILQEELLFRFPLRLMSYLSIISGKMNHLAVMMI